MTERRADLLSAGRWQALERPACLLSRTLAVFFTGFLVVLSGLVNPPASASGFFHPEARVATIAEPVSQFVGFHGSVLAVEGRQRSLSYDRSATGSSVAARSGTPRIATTPVRATSHAYDPARSQSWRQLTAPVVDAVEQHCECCDHERDGQAEGASHPTIHGRRGRSVTRSASGVRH